MTDESPISLAEYEERQRTAVRGATIRTALDESPDDWAESILIAKRKELPPQVVQRNLPEMRTWTKADDINELIGGGSKALQQKALDPEFMRLAVDDIPSLAQLSSEDVPKLTKGYGFAQAAKDQRAKRDNAWAKMVSDAQGDRFLASDGTEFNKGDNLSIDWRIGLNTLKSTYHGLQVANLIDFKSDPEAMLAAERHMQAIADIQKENAGLQTIMRDSTQKFFASSNEADVWGKLSAVGSALADDPIGVSTDLFVQSGPASLAMLASAALARFGGANLAATGAAGGMASTVVETGNRYISNLQSGQTHEDAWNEAVVSGGVVGIFDALSIGSAGQAVGALAKQPLVQKLLTAAKEVGVQAAFGAGGEAWSGIVVNKQADPAEMAAEAIGEIFGSGFEGAVAAPKGALQAIFQGSRNGQSRLDDMQESMRQAEALAALFNSAAQSVTRQRTPEHFADLVQQAAEEHGAPTHIYVDGKMLADVLQQAGIDPASMPSVAAALTDDVTLNKDVAIPLGEATAALSGTGIEEMLLQQVKFEPGGMTIQESQQALEQASSILREEADKAIAKQANVDAWKASSSKVYDDLMGQLTQANRFTSDVNKVFASMARDMYIAAAGRAGITPEEMMARKPLRIQSVSPVAGVEYDQAQPFGPIFEQFGNDAKGAIAHLMQVKNGEAIGALQHPEVGAIDLVWGFEGTQDKNYKDGYGLAKIAKEHPEVLANLQELLSVMKVVRKSSNRVILESEDHKAAISLNWSGQAKKWVLSAYAKDKGSIPDATIHTTEGGADVSLLDASDESIDQQAQNFNSVLEQAVWHGSPHNVDRFSTEHIGSGEGAQAYGWGLYFAEDPGVAAGYHRALSHDPGVKEWKIGTMRLNERNYFDYTRRAGESTLENVRASLAEDLMINEADVRGVGQGEGFTKYVLDLLDAKIKDYEQSEEWPEGVVAMKQLRKELARPGALSVEYHPSEGGVYQVDISDEYVKDFLLWDKPVDESPALEKIQSNRKMMKAYDSAERQASARGENVTGELFYRELSGGYEYEGQEGASKALDAIGIKGIKYLDGNSRSDGTGYHNLVVFDDSIIELTHKDGKPVSKAERQAYLQKEQAPQGTFNPATSTISLLNAAKLTTFNHELAHFYLELLSDLADTDEATGPFLQDMNILLNWFGVPDLATWRSMTFEQRRPFHERFARGHEVYMFEGNAPSLELQGVFARAMAWFKDAYRSITEFAKAHGVVLNDEVRSVYDRMLASDQQIAMMQDAQNFRPLFENPGQAGMTPERWSSYQALGASKTEDAKAELSKRRLLDMQWLANARDRKIKELQLKAAGLRRLKRIQARAEILQQPVYAAWTFLTQPIDKVAKTPKKPVNKHVNPETDSLFMAMAKLGGINRDAIASEWGFDSADTPKPMLFGKPAVRVAGGLTVDGMAEALSQYGYLPTDENGKWDLHDFEDRFFEELHGREQFALQGLDQRYKEEIERHYGTEESQALDIDNMPGGRLDLADMKLRYGAEGFDKLKSMVRSDGLPIDLVAEHFGFSSGDEMVRALLAAEDPKTAIEGLTDQLMLQDHGELSDQASIERAANEAIHNDAHIRFLATELSAMNKALGDSRTLSKAASQVAAEVISRRKVRDLRVIEFSQAAAKAGRAAEKAFKSGDHSAAAQAKRNQILNSAATKAALEAQRDIENALKYFKKFDSDRIRKRVDPDYVDQIDALLDRFYLRKGVPLKEVDKRKSLQEWIAATTESLGVEPNIDPALINEANRKHYKDMTVQEVRGLLDAVRQIEHIGRLKSKLLLALDKREFNAAVDEAVATIEGNSTRVVKDRIERNTKLDTLRDLGLEFFAMHRKFASLIREMDGGKDGGYLWNLFVRPMNTRGDYEAVQREQATRALDAIFKETIKAGGLKEKLYIPEINGSLSKEGRLMVALNWGNEGGRQRTMDGDRWSMPQVQAILDTLTEQDWKFVQSVWDYIDSFWPEIAAKERRVTGSEPEKVEAAPVQTKFGQLRGGYFPIMYDPMRSSKAENFADAEAAKQMMQGAVTRATTRRGHTKARAEEVTGRPLRKDFGVISQHVNQVIHDLAWHEWLIDTNRLLRNGKIDDAIRDHYGPETTKMLKKAVSDIAAGEAGAQNAFERSINHLRNGVTVASLGYNLFTSLLQPLGLTQSMVRIGPKWVLRGIGELLSDPSKANQKAEWVYSKSDFMRMRRKTMQREINEVLNKVDNKYSNVEASFFWVIQKAQLLADLPTWLGAYEKAMSGNADEASAIAMADQAVLDSQGGGQVKDLAAIQRGGPLLKLWTNFYSYFNVIYNLAVERTKATKFSDPAQVAALAMDYAMLMVVPSVLQTLVRDALTGGDDDDDKLVKKLIQDEISYMLGMVIGLREIGSAFTGYSGYGGPAGLRFFAEMAKLGKQVGQGEADMAAFKALNNTMGILFHYPAGQINRTVEAMAAINEGKVEGAAIVPALVFGPPR